MNRIEAFRAAAGSYSPAPAPFAERIQWQDISADLFASGEDVAIAVKGTDPENIENLLRDADIADFSSVEHPRLGPLFAGAAHAALGLLPLIKARIGARRLIPIGHSLGGQIAVDIAAFAEDEGIIIAELWGMDNPKSGGPLLGVAVAQLPIQIFRFAGSIVSRWPFDRGQHVREPIEVGDWTANTVEAHSIDRSTAWITSH